MGHRSHVLSSYQSFASRLHNMADEKAAEARKKAEELDKEIDEFMDSLKKKSDGKKREIDFKEERWEEVKKISIQNCLTHVSHRKKRLGYKLKLSLSLNVCLF